MEIVPFKNIVKKRVLEWFLMTQLQMELFLTSNAGVLQDRLGEVAAESFTSGPIKLFDHYFSQEFVKMA